MSLDLGVLAIVHYGFVILKNKCVLNNKKRNFNNLVKIPEITEI
jgi:hypothetical protein